MPYAFKRIAEKVAPKLTKILGSDYGRKKLINFLSKKISTKLATSIVGIGSGIGVFAGIAGTAWSAAEIWKFIRDFKEE
jgi:hypothetical protein